MRHLHVPLASSADSNHLLVCNRITMPQPTGSAINTFHSHASAYVTLVRLFSVIESIPLIPFGSHFEGGAGADNGASRTV